MKLDIPPNVAIQIKTHPWFRLFQGPTNGKI
jgi:hypothetical protein